MKLPVEVQELTGNIVHRNENLSLPAFIKHMAFAGCHLMPQRLRLCRCIGMFFHYSHYLKSKDFNNSTSRFSNPPDSIYDQTEKSQFSTDAGKAIADFLSKRIDKSMFTVNYYAALKLSGRKIRHNKGDSRPDLLAFSKRGVFAIESKGHIQFRTKTMEKCKKQLQNCKFNIKFGVASISTELYNKIKCKYYKFSHCNNNIAIGNLLREPSKKYYLEFSEFMNEKYNKELFPYRNEEFYKIDLFRNIEYFEEDFEFPFNIWLKRILCLYRPKLIIPKDIKKYAENGLPDEIEPLEFEGENNIYIDNDRIGIELDINKKDLDSCKLRCIDFCKLRCID